MEPTTIDIIGAKEHNLKNVQVSIPKKQFVVFTGPSGSGKSSLAIDTIYVEGRRRFVESLSAYARQFLGQKEKPKFEKIHGLSPTIAVEQKSASTNPRSTVGTITEILDYLRVLYARLGTQFCPGCDQPVSRQSAQQIVNWIASRPPKTKIILLAPVIQNRKGEHKDVLDSLRAKGLVRARVNGEFFMLEDKKTLNKRKKNTLDAVIDRLVVKDGIKARLTDSVETALSIGEGRLIVHVPDQGDTMLSERLACEACARSFPDLTPQSFSFNSPQGMCHQCNGLGYKLEMDPNLIVPDHSKSVEDGAFAIWSSRHADNKSFSFGIIRSFADHFKINLSKPWKKLTERHKDLLLNGSRTEIEVRFEGKKFKGDYKTRFEGIVPMMKRRFLQTQSEGMKRYYMQFMSNKSCDECKGRRLREESQHVFIDKRSLPDLCKLSVRDVKDFFEGFSSQMEGEMKKIGQELLKEVRNRLTFLTNVGLDYLSLERKGPSLSGGESQRIQLASQLGSELSGVIYVLDEPSIGLHARDALKLIKTLHNLRDQGNSVIVVEHDRDTIEAADWLVDFGPGAGSQGGTITAQGAPKELAKDKNSLTGRYLSNELFIEIPSTRRPIDKKRVIEIKGARENNLKNINVKFPLGAFVCVTGVSGAGKSTLVNQILLPAISRTLNNSSKMPGEHDSIKGLEYLDKIIAIDQQPIGRTPRSNPATYVKLWDLIRTFYAQLPESKAYGFKAGRFSFNVKGGRCEDCQGSGVKKVEMHFLPDVFVTCQECGGLRFNEATLRVKYQGHNIAEVLAMTVKDGLEFFRNHPKITKILQTLDDVGLGYIQIGQQSPTLSGGEAQRVKLSRELCKRQTGSTFYILDEPSTGLHFDDTKKLLKVLNRLVDAGNTVLVIEHNMDIIKMADWIIDIGPEGGAGGGEVVAAGTPEAVAKVKKSYTGKFLKDLMDLEKPLQKKKKSAAKPKRRRIVRKKTAGKKKTTKARAKP